MANYNDIIKLLREEKGWSQDVLADELSVSKSAVAMWETGKRFPGKEFCEQLADIFNVDLDYLYGRTDIRKKRHFDEYGNEYINSSIVNKHGYYANGNLIEISSNDRNLQTLLQRYYSLNDIGKKKILDNIEDLSKIYAKQTELKAAHNDKATDPEEVEKMEQDLKDLLD